jgi:hypothetical protein
VPRATMVLRCVRPWCCVACDHGAALVLRAACVHGAVCCVRLWYYMLRATVVLLHVWVRSNAPSAVECTMAGSSL